MGPGVHRDDSWRASPRRRAPEICGAPCRVSEHRLRVAPGPARCGQKLPLRMIGNLPAVDASKRFAISAACAGAQVGKELGIGGPMTLAEIEQAKHAA